MILVRMMVISLMLGLVAAGFVWFGSDLLQNLRAAAARKAAKPEAPPAPAEPKPKKGRAGASKGKGA